MLARLNIVEGIFSEQVGLLVLATDVRLIPATNDPFTATKGSTLLEQLGAYRKATPAVRARGLAHLMTGKDLDGTTAGIAYVRTVCEVETRRIDQLALLRHHHLGARHGARAGPQLRRRARRRTGHRPAPASPAASSWRSSVSGYSTFSQCSIDKMQPVIASASCVTPAEYADVTIDAGVTVGVGRGRRCRSRCRSSCAPPAMSLRRTRCLR